MVGLTLDAGALIAFERNDRAVILLLAGVHRLGLPVVVPACVVGQVWRDGRQQTRLARLLSASNVHVEILDDHRAREAGQLCGVKRTSDVIDASVVRCARARGHHVVTSDPDDLERLDPTLDLIVV